MTSRLSLCLAALSVCWAAAGPASAADEPLVLQPAAQWSVDFGAERCRLARPFGPEDNRHVMFIQQWAPSGGFSLTVAGPSFKRFRSQRATYVRFSADGSERETTPFVGNSQMFGKAVIYSDFAIDPGKAGDSSIADLVARANTGLPQLDLVDAGSVEFVSLRQGKRSVRLEVDALRDAFEIMNTCTQELVKDWGLDVDKHLSATRRASMTNFAAIARRVADNYPREALNRGEQAILRVRVLVDAQGKATDCIISNVTQTQRLDSPACRPLMQGT